MDKPTDVPALTGVTALPPSPSTKVDVTAPARHVCSLRAVPPPKMGMQRESWYLYDVVFDGEVIVENSITPEFDACRVLLARGLTGKLDIFDAVTKKLCMTVDIEKGAKLTVVELGRPAQPSPSGSRCLIA